MLGWQVLLLLISKLWPNPCARIHGALLLPSIAVSILTEDETGVATERFVREITLHLFLLFVAFLLNYYWIVTALSIIATLILTIIVYTVKLGMTDIISLNLLVVFSAFTIYATYFYEKRLKTQTTQLH